MRLWAWLALKMDPNIAKPRMNGSMIPRHMGQYVCVVGKQLEAGYDGRSFSLQTSDGQKVKVQFQQPQTEALSVYVEVLAKVESDCSLSEARIVNMGDNFDLEAYNEVIKLCSSFPELFKSHDL